MTRFLDDASVVVAYGVLVVIPIVLAVVLLPTRRRRAVALAALVTADCEDCRVAWEVRGTDPTEVAGRLDTVVAEHRRTRHGGMTR